ncbi:aromatic acid exporter family protein, partial [Streptomyces spiralis]
MAQWRRALLHAASGAWGRVTADIWPVVQQTAAASAAWLIARHLVDHRLPFFAPIAAVVALNAARGERGVNAVRLLLGVV